MSHGLDGRGIQMFLVTKPTMSLGPIEPSFQWVLGALVLQVKWLEHEVAHSSPPSAKVKNVVVVYM
jgi:hypothetical protein